MKHTFTLHAKGLTVDINEQKTLVDQFFGRGRPGSEKEYQIGEFDILQNARKTLDMKLSPEDYSTIYTFLQAVNMSLTEGFCRMADNLLKSSTNTLDEVETVKLNTGTESTGVIDVDCDVPTMYKILITLIISMRDFCHERLWNTLPKKQIATAPCESAHKICEKIAKEAGLKGETESETSDEANAALKGKTPRKKKAAEKAEKEKPILTKEFVNKKVLKLDEKKPKKETKKKTVTYRGFKKTVKTTEKKTKKAK